MKETDKLSKLNKFTRRAHTADEVYIFDVVLCDNEVDRDGERFSLDALSELKKLFVGKTGIFDHDPKSSGQTARIFDTYISSDGSAKTSHGEVYTCLKASAYMVRTGANADLICEIDGGIKKEVSISCSARERICSVCGADKSKKSCAHVKGKSYGSKTAHVILGGITDAYEWSFVAVPAQVNAGVTKRFGDGKTGIKSAPESSELLDKLCKKLYEDVTRLCFLSGNGAYQKALAASAEKMSPEELIEFRETLEKEYRSKAKPQLETEYEDFSSFKMQEVK